jgi:hypothetical protein
MEKPMKKKSPRQVRGDAGEAAVALEFERRGWTVQNLNNVRRNMPNADLVVEKDGRRFLISVKAYGVYGWISGGGLSKKVYEGTPLFNKSTSVEPADFVVFLSPEKPTPKDELPTEWRFLIVPVAEAERLFRLHIQAVMNKPKRDGTQRKPAGAVQDWIGPGPKPNDWGPDFHAQWATYEGNFAVLKS